MKKLIFLISVLLSLFVLFLVFYFRSHNYETEYEIDNVKIKEIFNKEQEYYQFILNYEDVEYTIISFEKYINKRKLITKIDISTENEMTCLTPTGKLNLYTVCSEDNQLISKDINDKVSKELIDTKDKFNIYDLDNKTFMLWNYHHFVLLNNDKYEEIKLFDKDIYNLNLIYDFDNYLLVPDYNNNYSFDKLFLIDVKKAKTKEIKLRYTLYFDGYFLGTNKNLVYFYDKKEEQEYYINLKKSKIYKTNNKIMVNGEWQKVSDYKLQDEKLKFYNDNVYNYKVIDNKLYSYVMNEEYLTKISDMNIKYLVKVDKQNVYFISDDTLYKYNPYDGMKALLSYSEWEFNYNNMIYIFN